MSLQGGKVPYTVILFYEWLILFTSVGDHMPFSQEEPFCDMSYVNPRIILDIKYATADNFVGKALYTLPKAYLRKSIALKLDRVQQALEKSGLGLKIWDAYRPLPVQQLMWNNFPDERYVADPIKGSAHNRGAAVDLTLVDAQGNELAMPTAFDDFTEKAHIAYEDLQQEVVANRELLIANMVKEGFVPLATEWWHFTVEHAEVHPLSSMTFEELVALQAPL